ncbi:MAG: glycosyltransferase family 2 protein [Anaeroplasmataceae bacterium]|nr:glycosyltransferase family 2 protein [Anaeroplasmataceae bacterium]MDE6414484.1 glycosyltransferase family 2 protein [Anaeroplasmataceae bacterium]
MENKPLVSVIMPVYKVEEFVGKTIESVLNQTYKNIEFYAVDDGSPDKSGEICEEYAKKDERLIVLHQTNAGAPAARNSAIKLAKGKYLYFIDSDDFIDPEMIETMVQYAEENELDLVVTGFKMEYFQSGKDITYETKSPHRIYELEEFKKEAHLYLNNSLLSLPWNKLFKNEIIASNNLTFPNTKWDDHHFNMDYLMHIKNIGFLEITMYHWYRSRKGSETMINYSDPNMFKKRVEHFEHIVKLYQVWNYMDEMTRTSINSYFAGRIIQCVQELVDNRKLTKKEKKDRIKEILNHPLVIEAFKDAKLSKKMKFLSKPIKKKSVHGSIRNMKMVNMVRKFFPKLFVKMKENEVHGSK